MIETILLGVAQDGGVPHAGCNCPTCAAVWTDPALQQHPVCLGLVDYSARRFWLIDATPAFPTQLHTMQALVASTGRTIPPATRHHPGDSKGEPLAVSGLRFSGIFLTHAHIGHYTGLIHLGREVMNTDHLPVYATSRMAAFLRGNAPWSGLVTDGNIELAELEPGRELALTPDLRISPISVPHRDEYSDTVAYLVRGPKRSLIYCPDIDEFGERHTFEQFSLPASYVDSALLDGTFFSPAELPGRDLSQIPHPLVTDTVARFAGVLNDVHFIHLNHSNPLWHEGPERVWLAEQGFKIGMFGQRWVL